jgi:hypothetical protein
MNTSQRTPSNNQHQMHPHQLNHHDHSLHNQNYFSIHQNVMPFRQNHHQNNNNNNNNNIPSMAFPVALPSHHHQHPHHHRTSQQTLTPIIPSTTTTTSIGTNKKKDKLFTSDQTPNGNTTKIALFPRSKPTLNMTPRPGTHTKQQIRSTTPPPLSQHGVGGGSLDGHRIHNKYSQISLTHSASSMTLGSSFASDAYPPLLMHYLPHHHQHHQHQMHPSQHFQTTQLQHHQVVSTPKPPRAPFTPLQKLEKRIHMHKIPLTMDEKQAKRALKEERETWGVRERVKVLEERRKVLESELLV